MKTFTTIGTASTIVNPVTKEEVKILKARKDGTKRIFFKPVVNVNDKEVMINSTLWARLGEAETLAKKYLNRNN